MLFNAASPECTYTIDGMGGGGVETLDNLWRDGTGLKILHEYFRFSDKEPSFRYPKDYFLH
jgi:hypothetical protein